MRRRRPTRYSWLQFNQLNIISQDSNEWGRATAWTVRTAANAATTKTMAMRCASVFDDSREGVGFSYTLLCEGREERYKHPFVSSPLYMQRHKHKSNLAIWRLATWQSGGGEDWSNCAKTEVGVGLVSSWCTQHSSPPVEISPGSHPLVAAAPL